MDEITLTMPRDERFRGVAHLVLGGLASRLGLTVDALQDLQLGLDTLLEHGTGDVTLCVRVAAESLEAEVGPCDDGLRGELEAASTDGIGLRRILDAIVDRVQLKERDGSLWVELLKRRSTNGTA